MDLGHLKGDELFSYLRENKKSLIQSKKEKLKLCDSVIHAAMPTGRDTKTSATKAEGSDDSIEVEKDTLNVTVVCNTAWVCDSHMDVLDAKAYDESISLRGNAIPHIADHEHSSTAHVGDVTKVYTKKLPLRELGLDQEGTTTALLMDSTIRKDYNEDVFKFYSNGKINQHSIGLTYGGLELAIDSNHEMDSEEKSVWDKYYPSVVNKEAVDARGYFWYVPKVDVRENSCVLFGSNPLTPTLSMKSEVVSTTQADKLDSPLENKEVLQVPQPQPTIGKTMTLEEAQGKILSLTEELTGVKSDLAAAKLDATANERTRVLSILKAQAAFGSEAQLVKAAMFAIEKGQDIEMVKSNFEFLKETIQGASHVDTSSKLDSTVTTTVSGFGAELMAGMKHAEANPITSVGVR